MWANEGRDTKTLDFSSSAGDGDGLQNGSMEDSKSMPTQAEVCGKLIEVVELVIMVVVGGGVAVVVVVVTETACRMEVWKIH